MKWLEVKIKTTEEAYDAISDMLNEAGAGGVVIEDPNDMRREAGKPGSLDYADSEFLQNLGDDVIIKAYFPEHINGSELKQLINEKVKFISNFLEVGQGLMEFSEVDDEDWSTAWKKYYSPFHITENIVIKPTWENYSPRERDIVIEIDPGMAFGTGTHETTRMCAELLEKNLRKGDEVVDVGCGTGILSIIAEKLDAAHITAIDIDEVAVRVARENCKLNGVENHVDVLSGVLGDFEQRKQRVDIIIANIIADVIIDISSLVKSCLKPAGRFITSGIIKDRKQEVIEACYKEGFELKDTRDSGEWVAMTFKCPNSL